MHKKIKSQIFKNNVLIENVHMHPNYRTTFNPRPPSKSCHLPKPYHALVSPQILVRSVLIKRVLH